MVKIKDIALMAGVSTATVSNVLNNNGRVSEETRQKILQVINELNYTPNKIAKSLKMKKTSTIGVIAEDVTVFNTPKIIDGINKAAEDAGLGILLVNLRIFQKVGTDFSDKEQLKLLLSNAFDQLLMNQVDGIIYIGTYSRDISEVMPTIHLPVVYTYCITANDDDYTINFNDDQGAYDATTYLINLGHREIALISGKIDSIHSHERFNGYRRALMDAGIPLNPALMRTGDWEINSGYHLAKELLTIANKPTAIVALNDLMAHGAIRAVQELGLKVPEDISVIGFDNREFTDFTTPRISTMSIPLYQMGKKSMEVLGKLILKDKPEVKKIKLNCSLVERESAR